MAHVVCLIANPERTPLDGATVAALQRALEQKSNTPVEILDPFRRIIIDEKRFDPAFLQQHAAEAAVAVGLALRHPGDKS